MDEAQTQFVADAQEIVEKLYQDLEQLRPARLHGPQRRELAARVFRRVHTLKGSAGTLGLKSVSEIAHEFEGVLDGVRLGRVEITDEVLDAFEDAVDAIAQALQNALTGGPQPDTTAVTQNLNDMAAKSRKQGTIATSLRSALPPEIAHSLSEYDLQHAREAIREGAKLFIVSAGFAIDTFDEKFRDLSRLLGQSGEIIATVPGESAAPDEISFRLLYAAELVAHELMRQALTLGRIEVSQLTLKPATVPSQGSTSLPSSLRSPVASVTPSVKVELGRLDELISDASELFRETNRALASAEGILRAKAGEGTGPRLRRQFIELEERLIKLRLVPCAEILERAATRAGRIAARQLGKQVEFEIAGSEVGIDKALADMIAEPLLHLVRNAVSHGIESPEERTAAGKNSTGSVKLATFSEGSRIHITVTDDGRGIDLDRIVASARQHGITTNDAGLTMDQCLRLIFRPGFSTAPEVSELAGRGIGLDVVDRAMEQAGGAVRLATEAGAGTTFVMILPAGLALVRCQTVRCGQRYYGVGTARVIGRRLLSAHEAAEIKSAHTVDWEGEPLPAFPLPYLLSEPSEMIMPAPQSLLVWQPDHHRPARRGVPDRVGLVVDSIEGEHETLVRSLGRHAARWHGIAGAAQLSDGNVALILDVEELIKAQELGQ